MKHFLTHGLIPRLLLFLIAVTSIALSGCIAQPVAKKYVNSRTDTLTPLPHDDSVIRKSLENGFSYILRPALDADAIYFILVVKAGAASENESEYGLAHFVEHMAFKKIDGLTETNVVNYMQTSGVEFGPELNAYTNYNATYYKINIPANNPELLSATLRIFQRWASGVIFESADFETEKKVILEEIRGSETQENKRRDIFTYGTRFEDHPVLGKERDVKSMTIDKLNAFYRRWYQPRRMALIVTGGFDTIEMRKKVQTVFNPLKNTSSAGFRYWTEPPKADMHVLRRIHPENEQKAIDLYYVEKLPKLSSVEELGYEKQIDFMKLMVKNRLKSSLKTNVPSSSIDIESFILNPNTRMNKIQLFITNDNYLEALSKLVLEMKNIGEQGFFSEEVTQAKIQKQNDLYLQEEKRSLYSETMRILESTLYNYPLIYPKDEDRIYKRVLEKISPEDILPHYRKLFGGDPNHVVLFAQDKKQQNLPSTMQLISVFQNVKNSPVAKKNQMNTTGTLDGLNVKPGKIVSREYSKFFSTIEFERWTCENGISFFIKEIPDYDIINFYFIAPGGKMALPQELLPAAELLDRGIDYIAIGELSNASVKQELKMRGIELDFFIEYSQHGIRGKFPKKHYRFLMEMIHRLIRYTRIDPAAYQSVKEKMLADKRQRDFSPSGKIQNLIEQSLFKDSPWRCAATAAKIEKVDVKDIQFVYQILFEQAKNFKFLYIGDKHHIYLEDAVQSYIASLPHTNANYNIVPAEDSTLSHSKNIIIDESPDHTSDVDLFYLADSYNPSISNMLFNEVLVYILNIRLTQAIREKHGLVYEIDAEEQPIGYPSTSNIIHIHFKCKPGNQSRIIELISYELDDLCGNGPKEQELHGAKESMQHDAKYLGHNASFILRLFERQYIYNYLNAENFGYLEKIDSLTQQDLKKWAQYYFTNKKGFLRAELNPKTKQ